MFIRISSIEYKRSMLRFQQQQLPHAQRVVCLCLHWNSCVSKMETANIILTNICHINLNHYWYIQELIIPFILLLNAYAYRSYDFSEGPNEHYLGARNIARKCGKMSVYMLLVYDKVLGKIGFFLARLSTKFLRTRLSVGGASLFENWILHGRRWTG